MHISWPLTTVKGTIEIKLSEKKMTMQLRGGGLVNWYFDLTTADGVILPFDTIEKKHIDCHFEGMHYTIQMEKGVFSQPANGAVWRMTPQGDTISLLF
jgi:hypothetical protein